MRLGIFGASLLVITACGTSADRSALDAGEGSKVDDALAAKVVGTYAIRSNLATIQKIPVIGNTPSLSSTYSLVSIVRAGEGLVVQEKACRIQISGSGPVVQSIPDALPQSIPLLTSPFRIWQDASSIRIAKDPVSAVLGATLSDPEKEALPTKPTDARVIDQDADGHPGVTVKVSGSLVSGEIYLVQRLRNSWAGTLNANGQLAALLTDAGEQSVIDASNAVLKSKINVAIDPDASKTNVSFVRLSETYSCARLIAETGTLFPAL